MFDILIQAIQISETLRWTRRWHSVILDHFRFEKRSFKEFCRSYKFTNRLLLIKRLFLKSLDTCLCNLAVPIGSERRNNPHKTCPFSLLLLEMTFGMLGAYFLTKWLHHEFMNFWHLDIVKSLERMDPSFRLYAIALIGITTQIKWDS